MVEPIHMSDWMKQDQAAVGVTPDNRAAVSDGEPPLLVKWMSAWLKAVVLLFLYSPKTTAFEHTPIAERKNYKNPSPGNGRLACRGKGWGSLSYFKYFSIVCRINGRLAAEL